MNNHLKKLMLLVVCLLFCAGMHAQTAAHEWRYIHKVKKQETVFGIAKEYGITLEQLMDANPEMKQPGFTLKKGDWMFVPYARKGDKEADNKKVGREMLKEQQARPVLTNVIKVGVMLPIHFDDGDGERMVEYYRGMMMALDSLTKSGINAEVTAWNLAKDSLVEKVLRDPRAYTLDVVIGPLYSHQLAPLSQFCKTHQIKLFIPFSIDGQEAATNPQIMQVYQSPQELGKKATEAFLQRFAASHHPIFINCNNPTDGKASFTTQLRQQATLKGMKASITNLNTPLEQFAKQFSRKKPNILILNTARSPELNRVFQKLDSLTKRHADIKVALYGYNEWFMYEKVDLAYFCKYEAYIPSTYYYNAGGKFVVPFEQNFNERWGEPLMKSCTPRMALLGYDHLSFLLHGIHKYGHDFHGTTAQPVTFKPLQSSLKFEQVGTGGGWQDESFRLVHYLPGGRKENIFY